ncbi:DUF1848 domain-containing protein [Desulfatibacillum alkenivorans]|jgi:hypothetical protein|nr:DUF1848 domain-containing protein [Desulfatibacillum alkenivorans]
MIISASSRTDIPAFYGAWFRNRLGAGYCLSVNAFNGRVYRVGLSHREVDGFFFWTKNLGPFMDNLAELHARGYPFIVHYTINGLPSFLEPSIPSVESCVSHLRQLTDDYGKKAAIWRYDPILITSETSFDFHRSNFACIARQLAGVVDDVAVAFASFSFKKTRANLSRAAREKGFSWEDPEVPAKQAFIRELASIASDNGITLRLCGQSECLTPGISSAVCIDAMRLSLVAGRLIPSKRPGHRGKECGCDYSRDIGAYDTCGHGCIYCYATTNHKASLSFCDQHDPMAEWLRGPRRLRGRSAKASFLEENHS